MEPVPNLCCQSHTSRPQQAGVCHTRGHHAKFAFLGETGQVLDLFAGRRVVEILRFISKLLLSLGSDNGGYIDSIRISRLISRRGVGV